MSDDWTISINIRPGGAPQISVHADTAEEAYNILGEIQNGEFIERVTDVTADYTAAHTAVAGLGKAGVSQQAASNRQMDPQGRTCSNCGEALYLVEGEKNNRKWKAYGHDGGGYGHDRHFIR